MHLSRGPNIESDIESDRMSTISPKNDGQLFYNITDLEVAIEWIDMADNDL